MNRSERGKALGAGGHDFHYRNEGTISLLTPISKGAREWIDDHVDADRQERGSVDTGEDGADDGDEESLGGAWSCPSEPPKLW